MASAAWAEAITKMSNTLLMKMVERASDEPEFVAYLIDLHLHHHSLSWDALAVELGLSPEQLGQLALCKRPQEANFREGVNQIAAFVPVVPLVLANFLRRAQALKVFRTSGGLSQMAARDHDPEDGG